MILSYTESRVKHIGYVVVLALGNIVLMNETTKDRTADHLFRTVLVLTVDSLTVETLRLMHSRTL